MKDDNRETLYEALLQVPIPTGLTKSEIIDEYLRCACVAANLHVNGELQTELLADLRMRIYSEYDRPYSKS